MSRDTLEVLAFGGFPPSRAKKGILDKYHDLECCESTRGIDKLLSQYEQDRREVTSLVEFNPGKLIDTIWKPNGPLAVDNDCQCRMGTGENRSPFACAQCSNLRRIVDFAIGGIERSFRIECGGKAGSSLVVSSASVSTTFLSWDNDSKQRAERYSQQYSDLKLCGTPDMSNLRCITGDSFTIRILLMWMIDKILTEKGLPHILKLHTAFVCSGTCYLLHDVPDSSDIAQLQAPLGRDIAWSIITQLVVVLLELSIVNFSHGSPSAKALTFMKSPVSYIYNGVHVQGSITLKIFDMWNSSATFGNVHYFPKNVTLSTHIERTIFSPEITVKKVSMAYCSDKKHLDICEEKDVALYKLTSSNIDIYAAIRHIGFPLYTGSFDLYCFMVSLMCDGSFFEAVIQDEKLHRLWSMMWLAEDLPIVESRIRAIHNKEPKREIEMESQRASDVVADIIRAIWLRCDILKLLWSLIKLGC